MRGFVEKSGWWAALSQIGGGVLVLLALISQLALGSLVIPEETPVVAVMCHGGAPSRTHRHIQSAVIPLSFALELPGMVLSPAPFLPVAPGASIGGRMRVHGPRAPPSHAVIAFYARGPPSLI